MGCRLRSRLLDRCRLTRLLLILFIFIAILSYRRRSALYSHAHKISGLSAAHELAEAISFGKRLTATDASQPQYAQALCRQHGLGVFDKKAVPKPGTGSSKRKVFDLLTINSELDWLEIHLNSTYDFVDYFVIVEGTKTTAGLEKQLLVRENWDRLSAYRNKIIYHELDYAAGLGSQRRDNFEDHQRNAPFTQVFPNLTGVQSPTQGDVLLVANVDELVRPEALLVLRACEMPRRLTLHSQLYFYSFQFLHRGMDWPHPQATTYQGMDGTILPDDLRKGDGAREWGLLAPVARWSDKDSLWNAGWHCSSCFSTVEELVRTMEESHMLPNTPEVQERDRVTVWMSRREEAFDRIENNEDVPPALKADKERWRYLLDRNGTSAGFEYFS
ncbi:unnamed protein product [Discula destructiva]